MALLRTKTVKERANGHGRDGGECLALRSSKHSDFEAVADGLASLLAFATIPLWLFVFSEEPVTMYL